MKSDRQSVLARVALAALMTGAGTTAVAQVPGAQGQPTTRQERPDRRPDSAKAAENYDPIGMPVGSFRLFPELELDEVYSDNIYATSSAIGKTGSFIQIVKPTLELRSDWSRHMLNFFANGGFGIYSVNSGENYQDFAAGTEGRVDIQRDWNVYAGGSYNRRHEERGQPNTVVSNELNKYDQIIGNAGYFQKFGPISRCART